MATFTSTEVSYGKGTGAWSSISTNPITFGNGYCIKLKIETMNMVSIASAMLFYIYKQGTGSPFGKIYTSASLITYPQDVPAQGLYVKDITFGSTAGWKTSDLVGYESKFNIYSGAFFLYIYPDATITSIYSFTGATADRPHIDATYITGATRVYNGSAWKSGTVYVYDGTNWKSGVGYVHDGTNWKLGI